MTIPNTSSSQGTSGLEYTKKFCKGMLKNSIFVGTFQEKLFVEKLNAYRDVVKVSPGEDKFITNLKVAKNKLDREILTDPWIGITEADETPITYRLWVILPETVLGEFWFRVKSVEFLSKEIRLKLEIVRNYERESTPIRGDNINESVSMILQEKKVQLQENFLYFFKHILIWDNIKETVIFAIMLLGAILASLCSATKYLLEYVLRLIREISGFVRASTPILVNFMGLIYRCVYSLYQLIYSLFRPNPVPTPVYNNYITFDPQTGFSDPRLRYNQYFNNKALPYYPTARRGPTITPLD
ncbi:uncharacterized protein [Diabrotica undecimpunctata]|uniref:uncharacterized protein n=1 Tax=Diabrotica undecimpunctata TaxID=50387 RepID=UPI003B6377D0